jgi:hypothetical protein
MEKINDLIVLFLTYFNFLFTDLIPEPVNRYFIGWFYVGLVGILLVTNLSVMICCGVTGVMETVKEKLVQVKQCWANRKKDGQKPNTAKKEQLKPLVNR